MTDKEFTTVANDLVVSIEYTLTVDGELIDSSEGEGPLDYLHGHANIIPGLEKELTGMSIGDSKKVKVAPAEAYGELDEEAVIEIPRDEFPEDVPLEPGIELEITDDEGDTMFAQIVEIGDDNILLDTNHPLAGKTLHFDVKVTGLREATDVELEHGHVHFGHDH